MLEKPDSVHVEHVFTPGLAVDASKAGTPGIVMFSRAVGLLFKEAPARDYIRV